MTVCSGHGVGEGASTPGTPPGKDPPSDPPSDPPTDPPSDPPSPTCEVAVEVETLEGSVACDYGSVSNITPATLLGVEAVPESDGLRFEMQGCPDGQDCVCAITVSCVGSDIAGFYAGALPLAVQASVQPDELILGHPGAWECIDCGYGPPFFHAGARVLEPSMNGTISVEAGAVTGSFQIGGASYETHALDGAAYAIGGLAPIQMLLGTATVEQNQTIALVMDDDLLALSLRNRGSTWCVAGCSPGDPLVGSASWVVFGPAYP